MAHQGRFMLYRGIASLDPYVSCVASYDGYVVFASRLGTLNLLREGKIHLLHAHDGDIVDLVFRKLRHSSSVNTYLLICATSTGSVYVHVVHVEDVVTSRVARKWRLGYPVLGLAVSPNFTLFGSLKRQSVDLTEKLAPGGDWDWDSCTANVLHAQVIVALANGLIYCIAYADQMTEESHIQVMPFGNHDSVNRLLRFAWRGDLVAWSHLRGIQVYSLATSSNVCHLPFKCDVNWDDVISLEPKISHCCDHNNDFYDTSDESCSDASSDYTGVSHDLIFKSIVTHSVLHNVSNNLSNQYDDCHIRLAWLNDELLVVGYMHIIEIIKIIVPEPNDQVDGPKYLAKICVDPISPGGLSKSSYGLHTTNSGFLRNQKVGVLTWSYKLPQHRVESLHEIYETMGDSKVGFAAVFSLFNYDKVENENGKHLSPSAEDGNLDTMLKFSTVDACLGVDEPTVSTVLHMLHARKCKMVAGEMLHATFGRSTESEDSWDLKSSQRLKAYNLVCVDYYNYEHCLIKNHRPPSAMPWQSANYCDGISSAPYGLDVYTCLDTPSGILYMACRNFLFSISSCSLEEYLEQLTRHNQFTYAMRVAAKYMEPPDFQRYLLQLLPRAMQGIFKSHHPSMQHVPAVEILTTYMELVQCFQKDAKESLITRLIQEMHKWSRVSWLLAHVPKLYLGSTYILDSLKDKHLEPILSLRMILYHNLEVKQTMRVAEELKEYILSRVSTMKLLQEQNCNLRIQYLQEISCEVASMDIPTMLSGCKYAQGTCKYNNSTSTSIEPNFCYNSDFEMLEWVFAPKGDVYGDISNCPLDIHLRCALFGLGRLLLVHGHIASSFGLVALSQAPLSLEIARCLGDAEEFEVLLVRLPLLFYINTEDACTLVVEHLNQHLDCIHLENQRHLYALYNSLYNASLLREGLQVAYVDLCMKHDTIARAAKVTLSLCADYTDADKRKKMLKLFLNLADQNIGRIHLQNFKDREGRLFLLLDYSLLKLQLESQLDVCQEQLIYDLVLVTRLSSMVGNCTITTHEHILSIASAMHIPISTVAKAIRLLTNRKDVSKYITANMELHNSVEMSWQSKSSSIKIYTHARVQAQAMGRDCSTNLLDHFSNRSHSDHYSNTLDAFKIFSGTIASINTRKSTRKRSLLCPVNICNDDMYFV